MRTKLGKYFGTKEFYKSVFILVLPMIIQQGVTSFVNLLDNVMVGALSTEAISGVAIVNQLVFVFNLSIFGGFSGAGIFGAQFAGNKDQNGVRGTFRFKLILGIIVTAASVLVLSFFSEPLINLYLTDTAGDGADLALTFSEAKGYLIYTLWGLAPFMLSQAYSSTLRELGQTTMPMVASVASLITNLTLNWCLIYGNLGLPAMGVRGAALATVIARFVELAILLVFCYTHTKDYEFLRHAYRGLFKIPRDLVGKIIRVGTPLMLNEVLWSVGMAAVNQRYSLRGLSVVAAVNITTTVWHLFTIIMMAMGTAISIRVGQQLGAGEIERAKDTDRKLIVFSFLAHVGIGALAFALAGVIPQIYNVEVEVRQLTTQLLMIAALSLPLHSITHACYFTLRTGGRTVLTFFFDCGFIWIFSVPVSTILCQYTDWSMFAIYFCMQFADVVKILFAWPFMRGGSWARNIISDTHTVEE